jgi:hypothetical protein
VRLLEEANPALAGQRCLVAPEEIVLEVLRDGLLKLRTATPWGLRPLITCLIVLSLPDASKPLQHDQQSELVVAARRSW